MQFLISLHINPAVLDALTDGEKAALGGGHGKFIEELKRSGELITTQALADPSQAAVVSVRNGQPVVTDGPFLEAKEYLGGFYLVDCEDIEDLLREVTPQVLGALARRHGQLAGCEDAVQEAVLAAAVQRRPATRPGHTSTTGAPRSPPPASPSGATWNRAPAG